MNATKRRLLDATAEVLRVDGLAGLAARPIAARAGVNQALIFYHFAGVSDLVDQAVRLAVDTSLAGYVQEFERVGTMSELLRLGSALHERELVTGNVAIMAQVMAGAQHDDALAGAARYALDVWTAQIEPVVQRVVNGSPLAEVVDVPGLTRAVVASFLGLELYDGVDRDGARSAISSLEALGAVAEMLDDLGPVGRTALRATIRRRRRSRG